MQKVAVNVDHHVEVSVPNHQVEVTSTISDFDELGDLEEKAGTDLAELRNTECDAKDNLEVPRQPQSD